LQSRLAYINSLDNISKRATTIQECVLCQTLTYATKNSVCTSE
jgi:hypothetical protein